MGEVGTALLLLTMDSQSVLRNLNEALWAGRKRDTHLTVLPTTRLDVL